MSARRAVLPDLDAKGAIAAPSHYAREFPEGLHDQRNHLLVRNGVVDLDPGPARRKVQHTALEIPRRRLKLGTPEAPLTWIFSTLRLSPSYARGARGFGFHRGSLFTGNSVEAVRVQDGTELNIKNRWHCRSDIRQGLALGERADPALISWAGLPKPANAVLFKQAAPSREFLVREIVEAAGLIETDKADPHRSYDPRLPARCPSCGVGGRQQREFQNLVSCDLRSVPDSHAPLVYVSGELAPR